MTQNSHSTFIPFSVTNGDSAQHIASQRPTGGGVEAAPGTAEAAAGGGAGRGRPSTYHPRIIEMLCQAVRQLGLSDSAAAEQMGLSTTTLSRWKQVHPEVGLQLQQARQEIRVLHLQKIMESASAENGKGWRASAWILERLFPEDYARRISDRFEALNLIEFRKDKERRQVNEEDEKERQARQRAEAATRAAQAAEAQASAATAAAACIYSEGASHNSRNSEAGAELLAGARNVGVAPEVSGDSRRNAEAPNSEAASVALCVYSESDSHNSRNAVEGESEEAATGPTGDGASQVKEPGRPRPVEPDREEAPLETPEATSAEAPADEGAVAGSRNSGRVRHDSLDAATRVVASCIYSEDAFRNSRNSGAFKTPPGVEGAGVAATVSMVSRRDAEAPNSTAAPVRSCIYADSDPLNSVRLPSAN